MALLVTVGVFFVEAQAVVRNVRRQVWLGPSGNLGLQVGVAGGKGEPFSRVGGRVSGRGGCSVLQGWSSLLAKLTVEIW